MTSRPRCALLPLALLCICLLCPAERLPAQEPAAKADPAATAAKSDDGERTVREQSIYIPYAKLRDVFEKNGRGVFLPYEEFRTLWQAARDKTPAAADQKPPVAALITEIDHEAAVEKTVVRVRARVKIELLAEGWHKIPLRLADAAITSATIANQPAKIVGEPGQDCWLLVEKKGKDPETLELVLDYAKAVVQLPGQNSVAFQPPQAPVSRWRITVPQTGVNVQVEPMIAAAEVPEEKPAAAPDKKPPEQTVVLAFVGAAPTVRIAWTPKAEGAAGLAAVASVQTQQQVFVHEGSIRTQARLTYTISRAELAQLTVDVPADQRVVNVTDEKVRKWSVAEVEGRKRITAQLFEPSKGTQLLVVELEKYAAEQPEAAAPKDKAAAPAAPLLVVPVVKAVDVGQQQGIVVVRLAEGLRGEAARVSANLIQLDASDLPADLSKTPWALAYRFAAADFDLALKVEKVQPRIQVDTLVEAYLERERLALDVAAIYTVERLGVFQLEFDVPSGYAVRNVQGRAMAGATPAQYGRHTLIEGPKGSRLVVELAGQAFSRKPDERVGLVVELQKNLDAATRQRLAQPGQPVAFSLPVPAPVSSTGAIERADGRLIVYAPESLRVDAAKNDDLRAVSAAEATAGMEPVRKQRPADLGAGLSFAFARGPVTLDLSAERKRPKVTVQQLLIATIESGAIHYRARLDYDVKYSGVKSLRVDVPRDIAEKINIETPGVERAAIEPLPADLDKRYVAWRITKGPELLGPQPVEFVWQQNFDLAAGGSRRFDVPCLKPMGQKPEDIDLASGKIVLRKAEGMYVEVAEKSGLDGIDPQTDIEPPVPDAARAFAFQRDWSLSVKVTQYELTDLKHTSIERGVVRAVVTGADEVSVQALYRMRSAQQRLALRLPADAKLDASPLRCNGNAIGLQRDAQGDLYVPLQQARPDEPFLLELRYTAPFDGRRLDLPEFPEEPAVVQVYLCVYLPADRTLLGTRGPWNQEFDWKPDPQQRWKPSPKQLDGGAWLNDGYLNAWVCEGVDLQSGSAEHFATDGQLYIYSTLRPEEGPSGSLRMTIVRSDRLRAWVFILVALGGVLLLPCGIAGRALAVGAAVVAIVLAGVFCPTCAMQILDGVFVAAVFLVFVLWAVWHFARTRPRMRALRAAASVPPPPPPVTVAPPPPAKIFGGVGAGIDLTRQSPPPPDENPPADPGAGGPSHA